ncbi:MAG: hypothetical protein K1X72_21665 [Pyrinomonadaceae bacterium]|nr:hypothetical protein [Pyrinomonadaceae bacterium]
MERENQLLNPVVHLFSKCPNCEKLIRVKSNGQELYIEEKNCQDCGFEFNSGEILQNLIKNTIITQAVSSASTLTGFDLAVFIFLPVIIFFLFVFPIVFPVFIFIKASFFFLTLTYLLPVFVCIRWLLKFGRWQFNDEEFIESKKNVKSTLKLWIVTHIFSIMMFLYKFWV